MSRRSLARAILVLLLLVVGTFGGVNYLYLRRLHWPPRFRGVAAAEVLLHAQPAIFRSSDGVTLAGSYLAGRDGAPAVVLCHDRLGDRSGVLRVAILLHKVGYSVLVFDFRGHGESGASAVTLGIREREDVLAALQWLRNREDVPSGQLGLWGIGMGANAALLASSEAKDVRALGLAFLYPDIRALARQEFETVFHAPAGMLEPLYARLFDRIAGSDASLYVPEKFLGDLADRQVLLLVAQDDSVGSAFVEDRVYPRLAPTHRTLIKVPTRSLPTEGAGRDGFELNTIQFFKSALPLP